MKFSIGFLLPLVQDIGPASFRRWVVNTIPWKTLHDIRDIVDILHNTSIDIFKSKKEELEHKDGVLSSQVGQGKDIMSILSEYFRPLMLPLTESLTHVRSEGKYDCSDRGKLV